MQNKDDKNKLCQTCIYVVECGQGNNVIIITCPDYKKDSQKTENIIDYS